MTSVGRDSGMALKRLRKAVAESKAMPINGPLRLTPFVGAGVTSAVTGGAACASWRGLLENGIDRCEQLVPVPTGWADRMRANLATADAISYMAVADEVKRRLKRRAEGRDFASWLEDTVGSLSRDKAGWELVGAIRDLNNRVIVTTNYDTLLEDAGPEPELYPQLDAFTWKDKGWNSATETDKLVVLHLHGMASNPESVILSSADYERLSSNDLGKIFDQHLIASRRFLFIGCGDGLYDPHVAPLMEKVAELLRPNPDGDKAESEGLEHFLLVRGSELRRFTADPLPERVAPVAYGPGYGDLAGFLRKLHNGIDPEVSQNPDDYKPKLAGAPAAPVPAPALHQMRDEMAGPPAELAAPTLPATLSLEVMALQRAREAHAALHRASRAMDQLAECMKLPDDLTAWEPADQQAEHELLAASAPDLAADLQARLREAANAVSAASVQAARVTLRTEPSVSGPARLAAAAADLEKISADLAGRVALADKDVKGRTTTSSGRYRILQTALDDARDEAEGAHRAAARMMRQLGGRRQEPVAEPGQAGNRAAAEPGPAGTTAARAVPQPDRTAAPSAPVEFTGDGVTRREPTALVAAGSGIEQPSVVEDQPQLFPSELLRGSAFVVRVVGESMAPRIHDGDYLVVDPNGHVYDGDIAVLEKEGIGHREAIVKKVFFGEDKPRYESANPDYPGGTLEQDDRAKLMGKVVAVSRTIG